MPIVQGGYFSPDNNIVSPGVFTREIDQSQVAQGVAQIGGVVVAPFKQGPGFTPTVCNSVAQLQNQFGIPDGTLYGPYTATQYLQEKGFVTVCRVGALTGYWQRYPWFIWAEEGVHTRNNDGGWINPLASTISIVGAYYSGSITTPLSTTSSINYSSSVTQSVMTITSGTGSVQLSASYIYGAISASKQQVTQSLFYGSNLQGAIIFPNSITSITLQSGAATAIDSLTPNISSSTSVPNSGSSLYNGSTITGYVNGYFPITNSINLNPNVNIVNSASIVTELLGEQKVVGNIQLQYVYQNSSSNFHVTTDPFENAGFSNLSVSQISQSLDFCNNPTLNFLALLEGAIGLYNGNFSPGSNVTYNQCTRTWVGSGSAYKVLAVLANTEFAGLGTNLQESGFYNSTMSRSPNVSGSNFISNQFNLQLSNSLGGGYGTYKFSLSPSDPQYITNVFGNTAQAGNPATYAPGTKIEAAYIYSIFQDDIDVVISNPVNWKIHGTVMPSGSWISEPLNFTDQYSLAPSTGDSQYSLTNATTPWVVSQQIAPWNGGTPHRFELFQFATLSDGTYTNQQLKIEISNVKLAGTVAGSDWGTFDVIVRSFSDTDKKPIILETFKGCTLDPNSAQFIGRAIGDRYNFIRFDGKIIEFGTYSNNSTNIRVITATNPYPVTSVPYGFEAYTAPIAGQMGQWCNPIAYSRASLYSENPGKYPSGIDFQGPPAGADAELTNLYPTSSAGEGHWQDNLQYFAPVPSGATVGTNTTFALDAFDGLNGVGTGFLLNPSLGGNIPSIYDPANETTYVKMRSFVFGFQGGFDGQSPSIEFNIGADITAGNTQGLNCATSTTAGSIAYAQCIGALGNPDEFDINLIVTPGILYSLHPYVTNLVVEMCENRGDCFYILDLYLDTGNPGEGQIDQVVSLAREFDTSYAGTYYPWIKILDTNTNDIVTVPPSVVIPAVYAANDRVAAEWWAAAGLNRGGIPQATQVTDRTTHLERDTLYEGMVNPIAAFPGQGIVVWGQKTLQVENSALNRINVRRLLIEVKKFFASTARFLVFEQNTAQTRNKFLAIVNPYLESVQQRSGLYAFQVVMDDSNNTPDVIDQNILYGQIYLQPVKSSEFILLDFNILPTGASFPNA